MTSSEEQNIQDFKDQEELEDIKYKFQLIDTDGDNRLCVSEVGTMVRALGFNPTDKDIEEMVKQLDKDGTGFVEFDEFKIFYKKRKAEIEDPKKHMKAAFKRFDKNDDGFIERAELKRVLQAFGGSGDESEIDDMIEAVDSNEDGKISIEELTDLMCHKKS